MEETRSQPGGPNGKTPASDAPPPREAWRLVMEEARELPAYAAQYLAAQADRFKLSVRKVVVAIVLGLLALLIGATVVIVSAGLLLIGLSEAIAVMLGGRAWAGDLIVGGGVLLIVGVGSWLGVRSFFNSSRKRTVKRYEDRLKEQRLSHGHDARERSAAEGPSV